MFGLDPAMADDNSVVGQELSIETILAQHTQLNGTIVRFRGMLAAGGMGNQGLCSDYGRGAKCLWFGGSGIFRDFRKREPEATRFIVQGRLNDACIRQQCTDAFAHVEDAVIIGQY